MAVTYILIVWLLIDRGGGPATAEFNSLETCEAAGIAVLQTNKYSQYQYYPSKNQGNYVCVKK
jgi:hypothetical protein